ncbi:MAG: MarR family winged helix-turn-helix transcriptional regulator [Verrucomicrobiae bacterium]|nr:MarR family winged helix-turn-helix transcriptional regulator [Verrucomicrobiae bacterium]
MRNNCPTKAEKPPPRRLPILLRRAWFSLNQAFRRRCAVLGLTPDQYTALRTLYEGGRAGMRQSDLVLAMSSDPNTIASLLRRMENCGWIERRPEATDRRARRVRLLPPGRRQFLKARRVALALQAEVLSSLPETDREKFLAELEKVADACRRAAQLSPAALTAQETAEEKREMSSAQSSTGSP